MKEKVYDDQISPLMTQIIAICAEHKIAFIADFSLDDGLKCTSARLEPDCHPTKDQLKAFDLLKPRCTYAFAETHQSMPDGSKRISIKRIS